MSNDNSGTSGAAGGIGFGCAIAITISWSAYHSVWWAIGHGICSWLFVIWWCIYGEPIQ